MYLVNTETNMTNSIKQSSRRTIKNVGMGKQHLKEFEVTLTTSYFKDFQDM